MHGAVTCLCMFRDMHTVEPNAGDEAVCFRGQGLFARSYGTYPFRKILSKTDLQERGPEVPIVHQVRISPVTAARFGSRITKGFEAEDARLAFDLPWAAPQSMLEDIHERVKVGSVYRLFELELHRISR